MAIQRMRMRNARKRTGGAGDRGKRGRGGRVCAGRRKTGVWACAGVTMGAGDVATAVVGVGGAAAAVAAVLMRTDPQQRRTSMAAKSGGDEMASVREYFNTSGFERWRKIYGETDDVNKVQLDIRTGHAQTVDKVLGWMEGHEEGGSVCDAGCGTGSLAIPLAMRGATVYGSDISSAMTGEAQRRFEAERGAGDVKGSAEFEAKDLESIEGSYDTVACLDVMIHYPQSKVWFSYTHIYIRHKSLLPPPSHTHRHTRAHSPRMCVLLLHARALHASPQQNDRQTD